MSATLLISCALALVLLIPQEAAMAGLAGAKQPVEHQNDMELEELAKFAVDEHNSKQAISFASHQNSDLKFVRLIKAERQVVAGIMHHLHLEVVSGGQISVYEAKVWVKAWENFKSLVDFKRSGNTATTADLGTKLDGSDSNEKGGSGLSSVSSNDPVVKEAAEEAVKLLQQRSNSLFPYKLKDVVSALAQGVGDVINFDLLLKVERGTKEEHFKADVSRTVQGAWTVKDIRLQQ